jgi:hypothetical protein
MSTPSIDTTVADHESTPRCAAHRMEGQQRQTLALQGLASTQPISTLSAHHGLSRKFVYQQMHKAAEALEHAFDAQVAEEAVLFYSHRHQGLAATGGDWLGAAMSQLLSGRH